MRIRTTAGGTIAAYDPALIDRGRFFTGFDVFGIRQTVRLYTDPPSTVSVIAGSDGDVFPTAVGQLVSRSGYLVTS